MKVCNECVTPYDADHFYAAPASPDGLASRCIRCALLHGRTPIGEYGTERRSRRSSDAKYGPDGSRSAFDKRMRASLGGKR